MDGRGVKQMDRQQLIDYIASTTHLYGMVPYEKVAEIYTEQTGDRVSAEEVRQLARESEEDMNRMFVWAEPEFLAHDTVMQEDEAELYLEATKGKPFYVPEAEELLRYRDDNYIEMTPQAQALDKFVSQRLLFDDEEVAELQGWIQSAANRAEGDAFQNLIAALQAGDYIGKLDPDDFEDLMRYSAHVYNHVRSWAHRGHTPYEVGEEILLGMPRPELDGSVQEKVDYILALTHLWGIAPVTKVREVFNQQNGTALADSDFAAVLKDPSAAEWLDRGFVHVKGDRFIHEELLDPEQFDYYSKQANGKPYYVPEKEELLLYVDADHYEVTPELGKFQRFAERKLFLGEETRASNWVDYAQYLAASNTPPAQAMGLLLDDEGIVFDDDKQANELIGLFFDMVNATRMWENRGHTPNEISGSGGLKVLSGGDSGSAGAGQPVVSDKVGRNDPCPCGSGKKYKKCCGKK
ncbi:YecA family protein [Bhargavaea ginsengi]|uniref:YecA family protein n=1 Tax=Bhargavaea ginsengi TaxID=426757 RepID=UPI003C77E06B